jgi:prepilin-type N-terminal cleavage/methylation domain-containing protein
MSRRRGGFTIIEMLVVTVLGSLVLMAAMRILILNQRTFTAQSEQIRGSRAIRAAVQVLSSELREVSPGGGDLVGMWSDSIHVRVARRLGIICHDTVSGSTVWRTFQIGDWFEAGDSVHVFADNLASSTSDDAWIKTAVQAVDTTSACGGSSAQALTFPSSTPFSADSVSGGAEVRSFEHLYYGLMAYDGGNYLGLRTPSGSWNALVGPLKSSGLSFSYLDASGATTATAADVKMIEITVVTLSDALDSTGSPISDSLTVVVNTRN